MARTPRPDPAKPEMTPEHWRRVKDLLERALERRAAERASFLDGACAGDAGLRRDVESLLAAEEELGDFIEQPAFDLHGAAEPPPEGVRLGPYRLLSEIGRGGMGRVYLAERADEAYEQQVAVKVLKRGLDTDEILDRFRRERQILAQLDHPNIARIVDGGTTEDGLPYFVMERVEGRPIDEYCDAEGLSIEKRLELFRTVCSAVQTAHQNLVVHRDLKPGNILVTADGTPKLLDFGIAKLLSPEQQAAPLTRAGWQFLTPEYASPEQVRGEAVTTASDVFSLGTLLVLLLTGRRPFATDGRSPLDRQRALLKAEPLRPSTLVTRPLTAAPETAAGEERPAASASLEELARRRGFEPRGLRKRLGGDLDAIALKALEKDPARRYGSVEQLSEDVRRHLQGLPVSASRDTFPYRTGKFIRRHRLAVGGAAAFVVLLVAFSITATLLLQNAIRERERADRERQVAERVTDFLETTFEIPDPGRSRGETVTAREILDQGRERIGEDLDTESEVRARLDVTMARSYRGLGLYEEAKPLAEESLRLRRRDTGEDHLAVAESLDLLASIERELGNGKEAERLLRQAIQLCRGRGAKGSTKYIEMLNNLAVLLSERGALEEAEELHQEVLAIKVELYGAESISVATTLHNLGKVLLEQRQNKQAEEYYRQALELRERLLGAPHRDVATTLNSLASAVERQGRTEEAERLYRQALSMRRAVYPDGHKDTATTLTNLALLLWRSGELVEAKSLLEEALALPESVLPADSWVRANLLRSLNAVFLDQRNGAAAEDAMRRALEVPAVSRNPALLADYHSALGEALLLQDKLDEAEPLLLDGYCTLVGLESRTKSDEKHLQQARQRLDELFARRGEAGREPTCPAAQEASAPAQLSGLLPSPIDASADGGGVITGRPRARKSRSTAKMAQSSATAKA